MKIKLNRVNLINLMSWNVPCQTTEPYMNLLKSKLPLENDGIILIVLCVFVFWS